ncbi:MAG: rod-determining factor RdfA [Halanaeroarchaeum sp.]
MSDETQSGGVSRSKVARVIDDYDLAGLGEELERKWTREDDRSSLRELATLFNRRVLEAALRDAGRTVSPHEVEHVYTLLTADDVTEGARVQKRRELERDGIDVDAVEADFVTHQAMHTYLRDVRGASLERDDRDPVESARETLERLRSRTVAVLRETVERLRDTDRVEAGDVDVYVEMRVHCEDCGADQDVAAFLENGGCECET